MRPKQTLFHTYVELEGTSYRTLDTVYPFWQYQNDKKRWVSTIHFETAKKLTSMLRRKEDGCYKTGNTTGQVQDSA